MAGRCVIGYGSRRFLEPFRFHWFADSLGLNRGSLDYTGSRISASDISELLTKEDDVHLKHLHACLEISFLESSTSSGSDGTVRLHVILRSSLLTE